LTDDYTPNRFSDFNYTSGPLKEELGEYDGQRERTPYTAVTECRERVDQQAAVIFV